MKQLKSREKRNSKKSGKIIIIAIISLLIFYFVMSLYFIKHFSFGTNIYETNLSGKTEKQAEEIIKDKINNYMITVKGRDNINCVIRGQDIELEYNDNGCLSTLKKDQKFLTWIKGIFAEEYSEDNNIVNFNEELLNSEIQKSDFCNPENWREPVNPSFVYNDGDIKIIPESEGSKIDKEALQNEIKKAVKKGETEIDISDSKCYINPDYKCSSEEVKKAQDELENMVRAQITYTGKKDKEILNGEKISSFLKVDNKMNVEVDQNAVKEYVDYLSLKYNTFGNTRTFCTHSGREIKIPGGNYGWIVDKNEEISEITETIMTGDRAEREPYYIQDAQSREDDDVGNTYVEIDMSSQYLWFYKDGEIIAQGDVVTGNASRNWSTPVGTYRLNYKQKDATLKGENYSSEVTYWMPFNNNIGIHDADWRSEFGGKIYLTNGSHGCVNAPEYLAKQIYENIEAGTAVICYYLDD